MRKPDVPNGTLADVLFIFCIILIFCAISDCRMKDMVLIKDNTIINVK